MDSLVRILGQLGLEQKAKPAIDLQTYVATRYGKSENSAQSEASTPTDEATETP